MSSEKLVEAALTAEAWVNRWADHVGNCEGGNRCTCGRTRVLYELRQALAAHEAEQRLAVKEGDAVAWLLTDKNINRIQIASVQRLIDRIKHAHHTDLIIRINGVDEHYEVDWIKHLIRATPNDQQAKDAARYRDLRSALYHTDVGIGEAEIAFKVYGSCPTIDEFDAAIDLLSTTKQEEV